MHFPENSTWNGPKVSVIIPTMATPARYQSLIRAVESVRIASSQPVRIIIVVNGDRYDQNLLKWLQSQSDVDLRYQETPSLPEAIKTGRSMVATEYFASLDDDDEYIDGAIDTRLIAMKRSPSIAVVATNGYRRKNGVDTVCYDTLMDALRNPLTTLFKFPWLNSANAMYRSDAVGIEYFENFHPYAEWTWLAFRLALHEKQVLMIDTPTFRINDSTESLSKSQAYEQAYEGLFNRMLACDPPREIVRLIQEKLGSVYHQKADTALSPGNRLGAFRWHLRSLVQPGGLRFMSFTRHFYLQSR